MTDASEKTNSTFRPRLGLFLARTCTSAWIGAATLFVVVGVTEVTRGGFDAATKDTLVTLRFPAFYLFGVVLVGYAWIGAWLAGNSPELSAGRRLLAIALLGIVLVLMAVDYFGIYQPLAQMVTPPGQPKSDDFTKYHQASKWINLVELFICCVTSWLINWPSEIKRRESDSQAS